MKMGKHLRLLLGVVAILGAASFGCKPTEPEQKSAEQEPILPSVDEEKPSVSKVVEDPKKKSAVQREAQPEAAPKIVAVEATHDFGKVSAGESVEHVFKIKNEGEGELRIERAKGT